MIALLVTVALSQSPACDERSIAALEAASEHVAMFDVAGAFAQLVPLASACEDAEIASVYLRGLVAAREAYRFGGSPESLAPVRTAITALEARAAGNRTAEIARVVLMAAAAAAQSEREEMGLLLEHARDLEVLQRAAGYGRALIVTAHEMAGDLWLQVHRFDDARLAYLSAAEHAGPTRRVILGLARSTLRLKDVSAACGHYRALASGWPRTAAVTPEIAEARAFLERPACAASQTGR